MNTVIMLIFLGILGYIIANIFYKMWFNSHLVTLKEDTNSNLMTSANIKDYIIFEYTLGGYMGMVSLSIPVIQQQIEVWDASHQFYLGNETVNTVFYIGYEVEKNSGRFFVYGEMKTKDEELRFSTFLGENPCRFIVFTDESNLAFIPDNKKINILESAENLDYVFAAMPWQKWGDKIFSHIHIEESNKLVPYGYYSKTWHPAHMTEGFNNGNMPSPLP